MNALYYIVVKIINVLVKLYFFWVFPCIQTAFYDDLRYMNSTDSIPF